MVAIPSPRTRRPSVFVIAGIVVDVLAARLIRGRVAHR